MTPLEECQSALQSQNCQAFLHLLRAGESGQTEDAYRMMFTGVMFDSFDAHPNIVHTAGALKSTAAGAYQFLKRTWDEVATALGLPDFSPIMQDTAAVYLIRRRGALADVLAGRIEVAISKCAKEWASLPGSPYGQPTRTLAQALAVYKSYGGVLAVAEPIQPSQPVPTSQPVSEKPMLPIIAALLPSLIEAIPKLGTLFGSGSEVATRNVKAAEIAFSVAKTALGAANEQEVVERIKSDPEAAQTVAKAVEANWYVITQEVGGGIAAARKADADFSGGAPWKSPVLWVTLALVPLVYLSLYAVLFRDGFSDDIKAMVLGAIFGGLLTGGIQSYFYGTSASSQRKTDMLSQ